MKKKYNTVGTVSKIVEIGKIETSNTHIHVTMCVYQLHLCEFIHFSASLSTPLRVYHLLSEYKLLHF